jgi:DNA-binding beta-propeller fold protein YncE/predicted RNA-binding protein
MLAAVAAVSVSAQSTWQVQQTFHVGGDGGWDYVTVDSPNHRVFVTRSTHTIAVDGVTGKLLGDIPGQKRSHGVALVPRLNRGFITDGGNGVILAFDLKTYAVLGTIQAEKDADGIIYNAKLDLVLAVSGDGGVLMTFHPNIDLKNAKVDSIDLGGKPEFLQSDGNRVYVNLTDKAEVAVVDMKARKVVADWPLAPGGHPTGMAIDPAGLHLFVGCRSPQNLIVMSTADGKVEAALPIGAGVDATGYDRGQAFASCRDGSLTVAGEKNGQWDVVQTLKTVAGARTMGIDLNSNKIYLPTAEMEPATTGRPQMKPDTFMIVEVGRQ